jgi:hypothetical protein
VQNKPNMPAIEIAQKFNLASLSCIMKEKQSIADEEVKCRGEAHKRKKHKIFSMRQSGKGVNIVV